MIVLPQCTRCHRTIPEDAPYDSCPSCLLLLALQNTPNQVDTDHLSDPTSDEIDDSDPPSDEDYSQLLSLASETELIPHLPNYSRQEEVGRGGTGIVYKAQQSGTERTVAIKFLLHGMGTAAERQRFRQEVKALGKLDHSHVVKVFEFGEEEGCPYYAMEYLGGGTLGNRQPTAETTPAGEILKDCFAHPRRAAELVKTLAEAVQKTHEAGLLHRDLKPSNILVSSDGTPKIADFGLVKPWGDLTDSIQLTRTANVLGSPAYMAPEQALARNEEIGPATDVYGLGGILYEITTGRLPFHGATATQTLDRVVHQPVDPPRASNPRIPKTLEAICLKALAKNPTERYPTAAALAEDLDHFLNGGPVTAKPLTTSQRLYWKFCHQYSRFAIGTLLTLILVGTTAAVIFYRPKKLTMTEEMIRQEIDSGRELSLLNPQGEPYFQRWDTSQHFLSTDEEYRSFTLVSDIGSEIELLPAEFVPPSYRLKIAIRHEYSKSQAGEAGFYFGKRSITSRESGSTTRYWNHLVFNPWLHQGQIRQPGADQFRLYSAVGIFPKGYPDPEPNGTRSVGYLPLHLRDNDQPSFTRFTVEVRPSGIEMWEETEGQKRKFKSDDGYRVYSEIRSEFLYKTNQLLWKNVLNLTKGVSDPDLQPQEQKWNGQGAFGIILRDRVRATFRNITIQKLDD